MQKQINTEEKKIEERELEIKNTNIKIEDLLKIEMRVGEIVSAEVVEGSEKLLKLKVDFGEEKEIESETGNIEKEKHTRTVFSGIRKFVNIEDIVGRQFPFVTNLEPRKMMGEYSEAMILASGEGDEFSLFNTQVKIKNGSLLR